MTEFFNNITSHFKKHSDKYLFLVVNLFVLNALFPGFFAGTHYIFPDLFFRYPAWNQELGEFSRQFSQMKSDFVEGYGNRAEFYDAIRNFQFPVWSPYRSFGRPLATYFLAGWSFPPMVFLAFFFKPPVVWSLGVIIKALLGSLGVYLFVKDLTKDRNAAIVASFVYPLTGYNVAWYLGVAGSAMGIPWLFYFARKIALSESRRSLYSALYALVLSCILLTGFISGIGYSMYAAGIYFVFLVSQRALSGKTLRIEALKSTIYYGLGTILGVGLIAWTLLPTLEFVEWANLGYRASNARGYFPLSTLNQFFNPFYYGDAYKAGFNGVSNFNETSSWVGGATLFFTILAIAKSKLNFQNFEKFLFLFIALFFMAIIYNGFGLLYVINKLPIFNSSLNTRVVAIVCFLFVILGSIGIANSKEFFPKQGKRSSHSILICISMLILFAILFKLKTISGIGWESVSRVKHLGELAIALTIISCLLFMHWQRNNPNSRWTLPLLILVFLPELLVYSNKMLPEIRKKHFFPQNTAIEYLQKTHTQFDRMLQTDLTFLHSPTERVYKLNSPIAHDFHTPLEKQLISKLIGEKNWPTPVNPEPKSADLVWGSPLLKLFGIKTIVTSPNFNVNRITDNKLEFYKLRKFDGKMAIYQSNKVREPIFLTRETKYIDIEKSDEITSFLSDPAFDPEKTTLVHDTEYLIQPDASTSYAQNSYKVINREIDRLKISTETSGRALLSISNTFYPGWNVYVNGVKKQVLRVNGIFKGVFVEAGNSVVELKYDPKSLANGIIFTLLSLISTALLLLMPKFAAFFGFLKGSIRQY